jgi:hypothetical protein
MDSAVAALSEISIFHISESAKKTYDGLNSPLKRQIQEKFSRPISAKTHEAYRAGTAREHELYHLRLTKNFRIVTRKIDDRYVILAIGNHDDTELFAHNYRGQAPSRIYTLAEAGIVPEEHRKPATSSALLAPLERFGGEPVRERQSLAHADDEIFNATLEFASILCKNASAAAQVESSQMRAISESLRIDFEHKLQTLGGEKQQLALRVDSLATRVEECARRESSHEQTTHGQAAAFEKLRNFLDERHAEQDSQLTTLGEIMRHAEGAILEQDQRIDSVHKQGAEFAQEAGREITAIKEQIQLQNEQFSTSVERLESLVQAVANRLEALQSGWEAQQAAVSRIEAELVAQRTRAKAAWAARSRDWADLRQAAIAQQAMSEQLQREVATAPAQALAALQGELAAIQHQNVAASAQQQERQVEQQRMLMAEMQRLRSELTAATKPWWRRLLG